MINKNEFFYELPEKLIAQEPLKNRASSRLLVVDRKTGKTEHKIFDEIINYLNPGDCLVLNDTKVIPARLIGTKKTGAVVEVLLLRRLSEGDWEAIVKPGRKFRQGDCVSFGGGKLKATALSVGDGGIRTVRLSHDGIFEEILDELGEMPLPPYITKKLTDKTRYQTVYAEKEGSAAAPTAGLHFTEDLLCRINEKGIKVAKVTLHVGLGTFRPIKAENILDHEMHSEYYALDEQNAEIINSCKQNGGRVICVGTTSVRTLETICGEDGKLRAQQGFTNIFIYPGYKFKILDGLITNFHLPESTLMALVSAFAGTESILSAYKEAVEKEYRFFSFGDCMAIL